MIKNKITMFLATLMVVSTIGGVNCTQVKASEVRVSASELNLANGEYTAKNKTSYIDSTNATGERMARAVVSEDSSVKVENGVIKMTVKFNGTMYGFLKDINVSLDGEVLETEINSEDKSITFEVPEVDSKVLMNMTVTVMGRNVSFYLQNDINSISSAK